MYYAVRPGEAVPDPPGISIVAVASGADRDALIIAHCADPAVRVVGTSSPARPLRLGEEIRSVWAIARMATRIAPGIVTSMTEAMALGEPARLSEDERQLLASWGVPPRWWGGQ